MSSSVPGDATPGALIWQWPTTHCYPPAVPPEPLRPCLLVRCMGRRTASLWHRYQLRRSLLRTQEIFGVVDAGARMTFDYFGYILVAGIIAAVRVG